MDTPEGKTLTGQRPMQREDIDMVRAMVDSMDSYPSPEIGYKIIQKLIGILDYVITERDDWKKRAMENMN